MGKAAKAPSRDDASARERGTGTAGRRSYGRNVASGALRWPVRSRVRGALALLVVGALAGLVVVAVAGGASTLHPYTDYQAAVTADAPASQYRFDEAAGATTLVDSVTAKTATNTKIVLGQDGPFRGSFAGSFDGTASAALSANPLAAATAFTVEGWVNWSGGASYNQEILDFGASASKYMHLSPASSATGNPLRFEIRTSSTSVVTVTGPTLAAGGWQYVAVTEDASGTLTLYVNGQQVGQTTGATLNPKSLGATSQNWFGKSHTSGAPLFKGSLSNIGMYSTALSAAQILQHYNKAEFPVVTASPTISGSFTDGGTMSVTSGTWTGLAPITISYQWNRGLPIPGATNSTYQLTSDDVGHYVRVTVKATNAAGTSSVLVGPAIAIRAAPPANTALPSVSGAIRAGATLTADNGSWSGTTPMSYAYQWRRCDPAGDNCTDIAGATDSSYRLTADDVDATVVVVVSASNAGGSASATSNPTTVVGPQPPENDVAPSISGTARAGDQLLADEGTWAGAAPIAFSYQWRRCDVDGGNCADIAGATDPSYDLGTDDIDHTVRVAVGASNVAGSASVTSAATSAVTPQPPGTTTAPSLSGAAREGELMTVEKGTWSGTAPLLFSYQWQRCATGGQCSDIAGADSASYTPAQGEVGYAVRAVVTATNAAGTVAASSAQSDVVAPAGTSGCTTVWSGASGTADWQTAGNWSAGQVPSAADRACVASGAMVRVAGPTQVGSLDGDGGVSLEGGSLQLTDATTPSTVGRFVQSDGILTGAGTLTISESLTWSGGTMAGPGATVLGAEATGTMSGSGSGYVGVRSTLDRTLRIDGTLHEDGGVVFLESNGLIDNRGTFVVNTESTQGSSNLTGVMAGNTSGGRIENRGLVTKTTTVNPTIVDWLGSQIGVPFANYHDGTVRAEAGQIMFTAGTPTSGPLGGGDPLAELPGTASTGAWSAADGARVEFIGGLFELGHDVEMSGQIAVDTMKLKLASLGAPSAEISLIGGEMEMTDPAVSSTVGRLTVEGGTLNGAGSLTVTDSMVWNSGHMDGSGTTTIAHDATADIWGTSWQYGPPAPVLNRTLRNDGTITINSGLMWIDRGGVIDNRASFVANTETSHGSPTDLTGILAGPNGSGQIHNRGTFEKTASINTPDYAWMAETRIDADYADEGTTVAHVGDFRFLRYIDLHPPAPEDAAGGSGGADWDSELAGGGNPAMPNLVTSCAGKPVNCATGNQFESQTDILVPGRGLGLDLTRTYNSQGAAAATSPGPFGYGWGASYSDRLKLDPTHNIATVVHANGSTVPFAMLTNGTYAAPARVQATLTKAADGSYLYRLPDQSLSTFDASGRLVRAADPNGNTTTLTYDGSRLTTITDPGGRPLTLTYNTDGTVATATDPAGQTVSYGYQNGELVTVTREGEDHPRWRFAYDGSHQLTSMTDGRGHTTTTGYDASRRVISQTDALQRTRTWDYSGNTTTIHNPSGDVTVERFAHGEPIETTRAASTAQETTQTIEYDDALAPIRVVDGEGHTSTFTYDDAGNRTSATDPNGHTTRWTYDDQRNVTSTTTPAGNKTEIAYDSHGNPTSISRELEDPDTGATQTQMTVNGYDDHGQLTSVTDPLERVTRYAYNDAGDRTRETNPAGETTTWAYDTDSRMTASVSPRGNAPGADPEQFTTHVTRDGLGRVTATTDPLGHTATSVYDGNDNVVETTDGENRRTQFTYDDEDQLTTVTRPDGSTQRTGFDDNGLVVSQTDGNEHTTTYRRDPAGQVTTVIDALQRETTSAYDHAGRLTSTTDAMGRTASYSYDQAGQLTDLDYSNPETPDVHFDYDADGQRTAMTDGTGESTYEYDSLGRLTESTNGHGETVRYGYDLADQQRTLVYPNGHTVTRGYDQAGRVESVTDWLGHTTTYAYDRDSNLLSTTLPSATGNADQYGYDNAGQLRSVTMAQGSDVTASLGYTRNNAGQLAGTAMQGLPGAAPEALQYDTNGRLGQLNTTGYAYDAADNPTRLGTTTDLTYDAASQLERATTPEGTVNYSSNAAGDRTSMTPATGSATSFGYDEASQLVSIQRAGDPTISYAYGGDGLRATKTKDGATTHFAWDHSSELPLLLSKDATSYVYGPDGLPLEQIDADGDVLFFHHDQLGSTRALTDESGQTVATFSYDAYGNPTGSTGTQTTPFGYAGEYTEADTGLVYLRARYYDPATGQFLTRDPLEMTTGAPYGYAAGDPANLTDPSGLCNINPFSDDNCAKAAVETANTVATRAWEGAVGEADGITSTLSLGHVTFSDVVGIDTSCYGPSYDIGRYAGDAAAAVIPVERGVRLVGKAREIWSAGRAGRDTIVSRKVVPTGGRKWRISLTGHRPPDPSSVDKMPHWGRNLPHYHRRPGIGKHRPWEGGL